MSKKKVLIIVPHNLYIRNYIQCNAFDGLEEDFDCYYAGSEQITIREQLSQKTNFVGFYKENRKQSKRSFDYFNVLMYKYRHKSSSFEFRVRRTYDIYKSSLLNNIKVILSQAIKLRFSLLKKIFGKYKVRVLSYEPFFKLYKRKFERLYRTNSDLLRMIKAVKPNIVLFPSSAYDPIGLDIVKSCKMFNISSFFLIDNWDNLSSKSILLEKPDYLGVWSQQSKEHAIGIQNFNESNIHILGTPRFNHYFKTRNLNLSSHFNFKYILFVGTAAAFDEAGILVKINDIMERNRSLFEGVKLVYRPHPWRQGKDTIADKNLYHVVIDPQLEGSYLKQISTITVQPNLSYYPALIQNSEFVMGGLTSMLIEALIFRKSFFALAYDDGINLTSPHNMYKYYVHFQGLEDLEAIRFCTSLENFSDEFIQYYRDRGPLDVKKIDKQRDYYLSQNEEYEYKDKLKLVVQEILKENAN